MSISQCVRQGCFHTSDDHKQGTGMCTVQGCACAALVASRETQSAPATPEANASASAPSDTRVSAKRASQRESMPAERASYTKVFRLPYQHKDGSTDTMKFYFTVGLYDDGRVGEVFVKADKVGTLASGALDSTAIFMSMLLQAGVPLKEVLDKIKGSRFPPSGFTGDADVKNCTSPLDLLARWLEHKFLPKKEGES